MDLFLLAVIIVPGHGFLGNEIMALFIFWGTLRFLSLLNLSFISLRFKFSACTRKKLPWYAWGL